MLGGFIAPNRLIQVGFRFSTFLVLVTLIVLIMVTTRRGQSPARHTKVMDPCPGPIKECRTQKIAILEHMTVMLCPQSLLRQEGP